MANSTDDLLLSQLADGELSHEQTVRTLLAALDDEASRDKLRQHLQLRQLTAAWRSQKPLNDLVPAAPAPMPVVAPKEAARGARRMGSVGGILAASLVGGLLVLAGMWGGRLTERHAGPVAGDGSPRLNGFDRLQREQLAQVFAFHESVAGPLKGYAADDKAIELEPADGETSGARPVAVILRLTAPGGKQPLSRDYVIVCRQGVPMAISLPQSDAKSPQGRLFLSPAVAEGGIGLQYSLTMEDQTGKAFPAVIAGKRSVGNDLRTLGEVALGDRLFRVEASAWPLDAAVQ